MSGGYSDLGEGAIIGDDAREQRLLRGKPGLRTEGTGTGAGTRM